MLYMPPTQTELLSSHIPTKIGGLLIGGSVVKSSGNSGGEQQQGQLQFSTGGNHQI